MGSLDGRGRIVVNLIAHLQRSLSRLSHRVQLGPCIRTGSLSSRSVDGNSLIRIGQFHLRADTRQVERSANGRILTVSMMARNYGETIVATLV